MRLPVDDESMNSKVIEFHLIRHCSTKSNIIDDIIFKFLVVTICGADQHFCTQVSEFILWV